MYEALQSKLAELGLTIDPTRVANKTTIESQALTALANNKTYLGITPTTAQNTAQIKALTRQMNGVIRLLLNKLDGTD